MLNKRVQILFDENKYSVLEQLAFEGKVSVGEFIRREMDNKINNREKEEKMKMEKIWKKQMEWRKSMKRKIKGPPITVEEILSLVREGRKYE